MASDSPTSEYKDSFTYPGRSSPPPTTSHVGNVTLASKQDGQDIHPGATASKDKDDDVHDPRERSGEKDELDTSPLGGNIDKRPPGGGGQKGPGGGGGGGKDGGGDYKDEKGDAMAKMNGGDKLDAHFMLPLNAKDHLHDSDDESESCTVNCLYYTMQCCECTIS